MVTESESVKIATRRLILRDSAAFAVLLSGAAVLFAITLFLFRSFSAHRAVLAQYWSSIGIDDLKTHHPDAAIAALRTALIYAPGSRSYELLLAQALGESNCSGCQEESYNYYMNLWETQPGNGSINLALARLDAQRKDRQAAINAYRAAIYGTWEGNGVDRRAEVRLELARYLIQGQDLSAARLELLTAGTNAPESFDRSMEIASMLQQVNDAGDARSYYQKALADRPSDSTALDAAGTLAYESGDFEAAYRLLARALDTKTDAPPDPQIRGMMEDAKRIMELVPADSLPLRERVDRILAARTIAKRRFDSCSARFADAPIPPVAIAQLDPRWSSAAATANAATLMRDPSLQDEAMQLVFDTEMEAQKSCSAATGDDALLLTLANSSRSTDSTTKRISGLVAPID
jgi:tetratricopeptide (TPR) repeat protein